MIQHPVAKTVTCEGSSGVGISELEETRAKVSISDGPPYPR